MKKIIHDKLKGEDNPEIVKYLAYARTNGARHLLLLIEMLTDDEEKYLAKRAYDIYIFKLQRASNIVKN